MRTAIVTVLSALVLAALIAPVASASYFLSVHEAKRAWYGRLEKNRHVEDYSVTHCRRIARNRVDCFIREWFDYGGGCRFTGITTIQANGYVYTKGRHVYCW
jgi:hypothetical protein